MRLSELFAPGKDSLVVYNFMYPRHPTDDRPGPETGETARLRLEEGPCPSCTALLVTHHRHVRAFRRMQKLFVWREARHLLMASRPPGS